MPLATDGAAVVDAVFEVIRLRVVGDAKVAALLVDQVGVVAIVPVVLSAGVLGSDSTGGRRVGAGGDRGGSGRAAGV